MCSSDPKPMDKYFFVELNKMVASKSENYQKIFFEKVNRLNTYLNCACRIFNDTEVAALIMIQLDEELKEKE
jgi:hypothetical protein